MLRLDDVTLTTGGIPILEDLQWAIMPGARIGLIGRNGCGKTTLLRALAGVDSPDSGTIHRQSGTIIGYLPQGATEGSEASVWDVARSGLSRFEPLERELEGAQRAADRNEHGAAERLATALDAWRMAGGYAIDERVGGVLHGLGFSTEQWAQGCDTLSGGWQMRVALARLLLSEPDIALLDEPTNHLDIHARDWLADFLANASFAVLIVSHDRALLDKATRETVEIRDHRLHHYACAFSRFLPEREARITIQNRTAAREQKERARMERFVERFGAKATKAAQARSVQKRLDRREDTEVVAPIGKLPKLRLPPAPEGPLETIELATANIGWTADATLQSNLNLTLRRGERVALIGPNGCGKSTLLQSIAGNLPLLGGRRRVAPKIRIGVFHQRITEDLPHEQSGLEVLTAAHPLVSPQKVRATLGALGSSGEKALQPIKSLSGGERARIALASLMLTPCNVLLLDEPSNHLDVETVQVLTTALATFDGALLLVTHDRALIESVATHVWQLGVDGLDAREWGPGQPLFAADEQATAAEHTEKKNSHTERKRLQRLLERAQRERDQVEANIDAAERELEALQEEAFAVAEDREAAERVEAKRQSIQQSIEDWMARWEELELTIEGSEVTKG